VLLSWIKAGTGRISVQIRYPPRRLICFLAVFCAISRGRRITNLQRYMGALDAVLPVSYDTAVFPSVLPFNHFSDLISVTACLKKVFPSLPVLFVYLPGVCRRLRLLRFIGIVSVFLFYPLSYM
jgi:hypothetical protein